MGTSTKVMNAIIIDVGLIIFSIAVYVALQFFKCCKCDGEDVEVEGHGNYFLTALFFNMHSFLQKR